MNRRPDFGFPDFRFQSFCRSISLLALSCGAAVALGMLTGCGPLDSNSDSNAGKPTAAANPQAPVPSALVTRADKAWSDADSPHSRVPELDLDAKCPLDLDTLVAGQKNKSFGSGVSGIGDSGHRAVCEGTKPSTTLSVGRFTDQAEFAELQADAVPQQEAGNEQTGSTENVDGRTFSVVRTTYPTNDTHIDYTVTVTDPAQLAYVVLQIETTDEARQTYSPNQAARDLSAMLTSIS